MATDLQKLHDDLDENLAEQRNIQLFHEAKAGIQDLMNTHCLFYTSNFNIFANTVGQLSQSENRIFNREQTLSAYNTYVIQYVIDKGEFDEEEISSQTSAMIELMDINNQLSYDNGEDVKAKIDDIRSKFNPNLTEAIENNVVEMWEGDKIEESTNLARKIVGKFDVKS